MNEAHLEPDWYPRPGANMGRSDARRNRRYGVHPGPLEALVDVRVLISLSGYDRRSPVLWPCASAETSCQAAQALRRFA